MSIMELGALGELVGAIAVVLTLIYLAIQVRYSREAVDANTQALDETRKLSMAQAYQSRANMTQGAAMAAADSPYLAEISMKEQNQGLDVLTDAERWSLFNYQLGFFIRLDNTHYQHEHGFIDDSYYRSVTTHLVRTHAPLWGQLGILGINRPDFSSEIDRILAEQL